MSKTKHLALYKTLSYIYERVQDDGGADVNVIQLGKYVWNEECDLDCILIRSIANNASRLLNKLARFGFIRYDGGLVFSNPRLRKCIPTKKGSSFFQRLKQEMSNA